MTNHIHMIVNCNEPHQLKDTIRDFKVWFPRNHAIELYSEKFTWTKVNYIHQNPVKSGFVRNPEDWVYSSASNYAELESPVLPEVYCLTPRLITER